MLEKAVAETGDQFQIYSSKEVPHSPRYHRVQLGATDITQVLYLGMTMGFNQVVNTVNGAMPSVVENAIKAGEEIAKKPSEN